MRHHRERRRMANGFPAIPVAFIQVSNSALGLLFYRRRKTQRSLSPLGAPCSREIGRKTAGKLP